MRQSLWLFVVVPLAAVAIGCGRPKSAPSQNSSGGDRQSSAQNAAPDQVVSRFLLAVRAGDAEKVEAVLTDKARREMARVNRYPRPPGSPAARFEIAEVRYKEDDENVSYVGSTWTDPDTPDGPKTYDITWILRREDHAWRVAGMATEVFPGEPPLVLDFENPEEMFARIKEADERLARRNPAATQELRATKPFDASSPAALR